MVAGSPKRRWTKPDDVPLLDAVIVCVVVLALLLVTGCARPACHLMAASIYCDGAPCGQALGYGPPGCDTSKPVVIDDRAQRPGRQSL